MMTKKIIHSKRNTILLLIILTVVCYSPIVKNQFVSFDDGVLIHDNQLVIADTTTIADIFSVRYLGPHYKPLVILSWRMEYQLFGNNPLPFHLNNLLLHILNTILLFFVGLRLLPKLKIPDEKAKLFSFVLSVVFAIHPLHVESVAWATERKDVLYSFFFLLSWLWYLKFLDEKKSIFLFASIFGYALSMLSKSMGITIIAVIIITDWAYHSKITKALVIQKIPYLLVFVAAMYLFGMFTKFDKIAVGLASSPVSGQVHNEFFFEAYPALFQRIIVASFRLIFWIVHIFLPVVLSVMYPREQFFGIAGKALLLFPALVGGLLFFTWKLRNKNLLFVFGVLFFLVTISPALAVNEKGVGVFLSDRYTYLPLVGIILAAIGLLSLLKTGTKLATFLFVGYLVFLGAKCYSQVKVWRNSESLWNNTINYFPNFARALNSRGFYYSKAGEKEKALRDLNRAIRNDPNFSGAYNNRCNLLFSMKQYEKALADIDFLLKKRPDYVKYVNTKAGILYNLGRTEEGIVFSERAIELDPENVGARKNLAINYLQSKKFKQAIVHWEKVVELEPNNALNYSDMGYVLLMLMRNNEAIKAYNRAIELQPNLAKAWYNRSFAYYRLGNKQKALENALQAKKLGANVTETYLSRLK